MDTERQDLRLYTLRLEGSALLLHERDYLAEVVAQSTEGEVENALVLATPEQVAKLPELLRVLDVAPASDGIYVGHTGIWYAVKDGAITQSGHWLVPREVLTSFRTAELPFSPAAAPGVVGERDPVCGQALKPGQEAANVTYQGQTYHFCSAECRDLFRRNPTKYSASPIGSGSAASS